MRVLLICDWFLKYSVAQSAALVRAGADVLLLCREHSLEFAGDAEERRQALDAAREAGVSVLEAPGRLWDPAAAPTLVSIRRQITRFAPDVIHVHELADPRAFAMLPRAPIVFTIHDPEDHPGRPMSRFAPKRWFLNGALVAWQARASAIVVHSDRLRAEVELRRHQRCVAVPHGLDVRAEPLPPPAERRVGFFGRLTPYKGLEVLARAMPRVWAARPEVRLSVAGSGSSVLALNDSRVRMQQGYVPEAAIESFFATTSIAVLPYTHASQSGPGSLAVGYGVPVVASRLGGLPDLTLDQSYLFDSGDHVGLAGAIVRHIDDDANIRARVLSELAEPRSWDAVSARTIELYEGLIRRR